MTLQSDFLNQNYCNMLRVEICNEGKNVKMALPDLVVKAIDSAGNSGRNLSWKVQESEKGTLIQLAWKTKSVVTGKTRMNDKVHTNWNNDNLPTIRTLDSAGPASIWRITAEEEDPTI